MKDKFFFDNREKDVHRAYSDCFHFVPGVSACSGFIAIWASLIIGTIIGLISSVISWWIQKNQQLWTSTGKHDVTYIHGVPGILGALAGREAIFFLQRTS